RADGTWENIGGMK
ncbi:hypothetical protein EC5905_1514, partial [Escherichia coli 5905]